jgi:hypothetical protein
MMFCMDMMLMMAWIVGFCHSRQHAGAICRPSPIQAGCPMRSESVARNNTASGRARNRVLPPISTSMTIPVETRTASITGFPSRADVPMVMPHGPAHARRRECAKTWEIETSARCALTIRTGRWCTSDSRNGNRTIRPRFLLITADAKQAQCRPPSSYLYGRPRLPRCFCVLLDRLGCSSISGLVAGNIPAGPDEIR